MQSRKTLRGRNALKAERKCSSSAAGQETKVARLTRELREAREQQAATSEVLGVISSSPGELEPVFEAILENATRICGGRLANLFLYSTHEHAFRLAAQRNAPAAYAERWAKSPVLRIGENPRNPLARLAKTKRVVAIPDLMVEPGYLNREPRFVALVEAAGARTHVLIPMLKEGELIGAIAVYRREVLPFTDRQIELLINFAKQAVIAIENTRLLSELRESLQQQTATSDVLKVISSSPGDLEPVFNAMLENATQICEAKYGLMFLYENGSFRTRALVGVPAALAEERRRNHPIIHPPPKTGVGIVLQTKKPAQIVDVLAEPEYVEPPPGFTKPAIVQFGGARTELAVPMLKDNQLVGAIVIYRTEVRPFTDKQIDLVTNFAAQAVIAIENARLLNELRQRTDDLSESLEQQTATSEVLRVISSSPGELEAVFNSILDNAVRICGARFGNLALYENGTMRLAAMHNAPLEFEKLRRENPVVPLDVSPLGAVVRTKKRLHVIDLTSEEPYARSALVKVAGARSMLAIPMLKDDELIGAINIYRQQVRPFTDKQIALLENFGAQAVIAIENTRLLNELRESLQQQTATANVFKVISRSTFELNPVLETLVESAATLCQAERSAIYVPETGSYQLAASYGYTDELKQFLAKARHEPGRGSVVPRVLLEGKIVHIPDVEADSEYTFLANRPATVKPWRTVLGVPLLREGKPIGVFVLTRAVLQPFDAKQIELIATFADQAVIAIENTRLLNELRESLQQQTATADVLKVISGSVYDLKPVFEIIGQRAEKLCDADLSVLSMVDGDLIRLASINGVSKEGVEAVRNAFYPMRRDDEAVTARTIRSGMICHVYDVLSDPLYAHKDAARAGGFRGSLGVPMIRDGQVIGAIFLARKQPGLFTDNQIQLVKTFADQAVIAIENARLFNETKEALERQTATADVLKAISRSTFDLGTVLQTLVEAAARLCDADQGTIAREHGGVFIRAASYGFSAEFVELVRNLPVEPARGSATGRALLEGRTVHIPDVAADSDYTFSEARELGGFRTILSVPMLRDGKAIGVLALTRIEVRPFTDKQIELVTTFADQAAIAIENVRLFESVEARTRELVKSLEDLSTAQDRLVQTEKLASLGQLTAGIAHEIKNPLNFVNNFSAVSAELIDELQQALAGANLDTKLRAEIGEIADMLQNNLDKVVQHGKRADAIVKNMLLHSRAGSGERRPVDINAVVEESLNLAYHGARAEKQGFNITLERSFDPAAGEVDLFPQEITRVLLNLISNGFYAATKRKAEANGGDYEPTLSAATKDLGDRVEIRIRDNGTGVPPEVKDKMFNPFFTTKPAGEGTGLGLSISHDIIVKQHAGAIEVDTRPGEYTEFRIILPRTAAILAKSGGERESSHIGGR